MWKGQLSRLTTKSHQYSFPFLSRVTGCGWKSSLLEILGTWSLSNQVQVMCLKWYEKPSFVYIPIQTNTFFQVISSSRPAWGSLRKPVQGKDRNVITSLVWSCDTIANSEKWKTQTLNHRRSFIDLHPSPIFMSLSAKCLSASYCLLFYIGKRIKRRYIQCFLHIPGS